MVNCASDQYSLKIWLSRLEEIIALNEWPLGLEMLCFIILIFNYLRWSIMFIKMKKIPIIMGQNILYFWTTI